MHPLLYFRLRDPDSKIGSSIGLDPWADTQIHDYTDHVQDERTNQDGWVELWIPPQGYIMMAPLR